MNEQDFEIASEAFRRVLTPESRVEKICEGLIFTEGPVWVDEGGYLLFNDIYGDRTCRWSEKDGLTTFKQPSGKTNGMTLDRQGRLITCGHYLRTLFREEKDGSITLLADRYDGKKLNSPNDVVVKSDDTIWFTDPPYGIKPEEQEQAANYVFRLDPDGTVTPVADDFIRPNGLAFSTDEKQLYIADAEHEERHHIRVFDVTSDNLLANGRVFTEIRPGIPDGFRLDTEGRVYTSAGDGVHVYSPQGELLGKILSPEAPANCTFGGPGKHTLFMTARTSVYRVVLATTGAQTP